MSMPDRMAGARRSMAAAGIEALLLSVGSDLPYLTGYRAMPLERLTMAVVTSSDAVLVIPELEAPRVDRRTLPMELHTWSETEDPVRLVAARLGRAGSIAVGTETWARFLIALQEAVPNASWSDAAPLLSELRIRKDPDELEKLSAVGAAADSVMERLRDMPFAGRSEADLAAEISALLRAAGHDTVEFAIVASGPNGASPHHEPSQRVMSAGDLVVCDFGGSMAGYQSDTTRTFRVGGVGAEEQDAYEALREAQQAAFDAVRPGVTCGEIDRTARTVLDGAGWGEYFIHRVGHGIGLDVHEEPYLVEGNATMLETGMVFSIEPGVYVPGRFGMRIEDIVAVTGDGAVRLNQSSRDLEPVD